MIKKLLNKNTANFDKIIIEPEKNSVNLVKVTTNFVGLVNMYTNKSIKGIALNDTDIAKIECFTRDYLFSCFTLNHTGKMQGKKSLTVSSCKCNEFCKKMQHVPGAICEHCFANDQLSIQHSTDNKMQRNANIWGSVIIPEKLLPYVPYEDFRIDSFGEFRNDIDVYNVMQLAKKNPSVKFRIWTKRPDLLQKYSDKYGKPGNCWFIYSSPFINDQNLKIFDLYPCIDSIFTVFDKKYIKEHNIVINCGGLSCVGCTGGKCYSDNPARLINEILK